MKLLHWIATHRDTVYLVFVPVATLLLAYRRFTKNYGRPNLISGFRHCFNCQRKLSVWRRITTESDYCSGRCRKQSIELIKRLSAERLVTRGPVKGLADRPVANIRARYDGQTLLRLSQSLVATERRRKGDFIAS